MEQIFYGPDWPTHIYANPNGTFGKIMAYLSSWSQLKLKPIYLNDIFDTSYFYPGASLISTYGNGRWCMDENCLIGASLICQSKDALIKIGNNVFIGSGSQIISSKAITIGNNVLISSDVIIQDNDAHSLNYEPRAHDIEYALARHLGNPLSEKDWSKIASEEIRICDNSWIGMRAIILKGVEIGERSIVGAGSVVTKSVPSDVVVAGNPAVIVKKL
jgi:acetyltransferase-like isoleucine patch superfamily enzyme